MNNKEWLYSLEPHELTEWFDAEHIDNLTQPETNLNADSIGLVDSQNDSREKLEADVRKWCGMYAYQADMVWTWLNRQAAITSREVDDKKAVVIMRQAEEICALKIEIEEFESYNAKMDELLCRLTNSKFSISFAYDVDFMESIINDEFEEQYNEGLE